MSLKLAHKFSILILLGGLIASICSAQTTDKPVERPILTKGDTWTYRSLDGWTDKELRQSEVIFAGIEDGKLVFRSTNKTTNEASTSITDLDMKPCRSMRNSSEIVCQGSYKFPALIGQKTTFDKLPYANGTGYFQGECTLSTAEKITVIAGTFDTLRIDCTGFWTNVFNSTSNGRYKETIWYAPSVKRQVKQYYETLMPSGAPDVKQITELTVYKIQ